MLATRLKQLREDRGVTQRDVSIATGITERNYQRYEAGTFNPRYEHLIVLADYFRVTTDYLMGRVKHPDYKYVQHDELEEYEGSEAHIESGYIVAGGTEQQLSELAAYLDERGLPYERTEVTQARTGLRDTGEG